ncbi:MAG: hypothetical protein M3286_07435 [Thermoproteota archaeon]|nr:hypothetical protein [Thermoproteota archaeon]
MGHLEKEKGKARTISIILSIATIVASTTTAMNTIATPVQATATTSAAPITTSNNTATTAATSSSEIMLSPQPIYQEHLRVVSMTPINETHMSITFSGNGTLTLPNTTETINTNSNGSALISFDTLSVQGKETIKTEDGGSSGGGETATATLYEIDRQPNNSTGESKGIIIAVVNTNSSTSGTLALLNGKILVGIDDIQTTTSESDIILWEWENGVSSSDNSSSNNDTTTIAAEATATSSSEIMLSPQPIYQEWSPEGNITPINQTHGIFTFNGDGMLTLPNTTQTINTTHNGTAVISFATSSGYGKETIRTENGETVTATVYEIVQPPSPSAPEGGGKGIVTAVFHTSSTGMLAPLNGVIAAGIDDMSTSGESHVTLWRWENGIS